MSLWWKHLPTFAPVCHTLWLHAEIIIWVQATVKVKETCSSDVHGVACCVFFGSSAECVWGIFLAWFRCSETPSLPERAAQMPKNTKPHWLIMFFFWGEVFLHYWKGSLRRLNSLHPLGSNVHWIIGCVWKWSGTPTKATVYISKFCGSLMYRKVHVSGPAVAHCLNFGSYLCPIMDTCYIL